MQGAHLVLRGHRDVRRTMVLWQCMLGHQPLASTHSGGHLHDLTVCRRPKLRPELM